MAASRGGSRAATTGIVGAAYPHGIETRFRDAGLAPIFGDLDGFVDAAQEFQYRALKYQIETLRWERPISGYVITELNDVQWESNGLMDVRNRPRAFAGRLANLQQPWLVIARAPRTAIRVGERLDVSVRLAGAAEPPDGARLAWRFGGQSGEAAIGAEPTTIALTARRRTRSRLFRSNSKRATATDGSCRATPSNSASSRRCAARAVAVPDRRGSVERARRDRLAESRRDAGERGHRRWRRA